MLQIFVIFHGPDKMLCPFCTRHDTKVVDSRVNELEVRRRRECTRCSKRFTTYEKAEVEVAVLKKDGQREPFNRDKIRRGLINAAHKRSITAVQIEAIIDKVERKTRKTGNWEIKSSILGRFVMKELLKIDKVAYLRFASVCKAFDDPLLFHEELALIKVKAD
jgi:transcriptional repressor NrdR